MSIAKEGRFGTVCIAKVLIFASYKKHTARRTVKNSGQPNGGKEFGFSHGTSNARGVVILISKNVEITVHNVISSQNGRFLILYVGINRKKYVLANVYAPNIGSPEFFWDFFDAVEQFHADHSIIRGDYNLAIDTRLDRMGTH